MENIVAILMLMDNRQTRSFIWSERRNNRLFPTELADFINLKDRPASQFALVNRLIAEFELLRNTPEDPVFECAGYGALADAEGLRWKKLEEGEAVTISVDHSDKPRALSWLSDEVIFDEWFGPWTVGNPHVKFEFAESGQKGDCHIKWEPIDGPNGTLAFVWQPSGDAEYMEAAGDLSGDMIIDNSESVFPVALVNEAGKHEVGHVLGIGHLNSIKDVMYPSARGQKKPLSKNDKKERDMRHPIQAAA